MKQISNIIILTFLSIASCGELKTKSPIIDLMRPYSGDTIRIDFNIGFVCDTVMMFKGENLIYNKIISTYETTGTADYFIISDFKDEDSSNYSLLINKNKTDILLSKKYRYYHFYLDSNQTLIIEKDSFPSFYD